MLKIRCEVWALISPYPFHTNKKFETTEEEKKKAKHLREIWYVFYWPFNLWLPKYWTQEHRICHVTFSIFSAVPFSLHIPTSNSWFVIKTYSPPYSSPFSPSNGIHNLSRYKIFPGCSQTCSLFVELSPDSTFPGSSKNRTFSPKNVSLLCIFVSLCMYSMKCIFNCRWSFL